MTEAGGRVPDILRHILSAAALLASHSATLAPARAVVDAARSGQLDAKRLDKLIAEAALAQMIANYRGELRRDSERLFVAEFHRALADGSADAVLNSLRPQFDEHAEAITASRAMINTESSTIIVAARDATTRTNIEQVCREGVRSTSRARLAPGSRCVGVSRVWV